MDRKLYDNDADVFVAVAFMLLYVVCVISAF